MANDENLNLLAKIDLISKSLGLPKQEQRTVLKMFKTYNTNERLLQLKRGSWQSKEPWFVIDDDATIKNILPIETLMHIIGTLRKTQQENFNLKLEKTIWQNIPIDFQDVWTVCMEEIKKIAKNQDALEVEIDIEKLVKNIKKEYPNLFLNIKDLYDNIEIQKI
jgi:hypothetical protein